MARTLLAAPGPVASGSTLLQLLAAARKDLNDVDLLLDAASASGSYDSALLLCSDAAACNPAFLGAVAKLLHPASSVLVHPGALGQVSRHLLGQPPLAAQAQHMLQLHAYTTATSQGHNPLHAIQESVQSALTLGGFVDCRPATGQEPLVRTWLTWRSAPLL